MLDFDTAKKDEVTAPILSIEDVYFTYPPQDGNSNFSLYIDMLDIYPGEKIALIGPNGAGKTTLLQMMAALEKPNKGAIRFNEIDIKAPKDKMQYYRSIAYVPQKPVLYDKSVFENIAIGLKIRGMPQLEIEEKIARITKALKIEHLISRSALKLSGGEARRVMLARALVLEPQILFLDEPFGDLDETIRKDLINDLLPILSESTPYPENLRDRSGCATIFVSHNQEETYQLADYFIVMLKGRIVQTGGSQELFAHPANPEIAEFIGVKNVLTAQVIGEEKGMLQVSIVTEIGTVSKLLVAADKPKNNEVIITIPPESIVIMTEQNDLSYSSPRNVISGTIKKVIPSRYFSWVEVNCGVILTVSVTNNAVSELALSSGKNVRLLIKSTAIKIMEKSSPL